MPEPMTPEQLAAIRARADERESGGVTRLTVGSLFSGIGGIDLGLERASMETRWFCESDAKCRVVLGRHWPGVPIHGDVLTLNGAEVEPVDIIAGGFPCQDVSVAGQRRGLAGARSGLFFEFVRVIRQMREATDGRSPAFALVENVPGLLSSHGGRDFAVVLGELAQLGALDIGWAVLDARWFGVPQRRRRVFVVVDFGGRRASQILALADGLSGHPAPCREAGPDVARALSGSAGSGRNKGADHDTYIPDVAYAVAAGQGGSKFGSGRHNQDTFIAYQCHGSNVGPLGTVRAGNGGLTGGVPFVTSVTGDRTHALTGEGSDASEDGTGRGTPIVAFGNRGLESGASAERLRAGSHGALPMVAIPFDTTQISSGENYRNPRADDPCHPLAAGAHAPAIAFTDRTRDGGKQTEWSEETADALMNPGAGGRTQEGRVLTGMTVRRLTPMECERLQGLPDGWTAGASDGTRYRQLGNSVAVPVVAWIARRIVAAEMEAPS